jgi:hypothetical protein
VALNQGSRSSLLALALKGSDKLDKGMSLLLLLRTVTRGFGSKREGKIAR